MTTPSGPDTTIQLGDTPCARCQTRRATVCDECRRALALRDFWTISRHPESLELGHEPCRMCSAGPPFWCGVCFIEAVASYREELRANREIPEWGDPIDHFGQRETGRALVFQARQIRDGADGEPEAAKPVLMRIAADMEQQGRMLAEPFGGVE